MSPALVPKEINQKNYKKNQKKKRKLKQKLQQKRKQAKIAAQQAKHGVLGDNNLLPLILAHLPINTLYAMRAVNQHWRNAVTNAITRLLGNYTKDAAIKARFSRLPIYIQRNILGKALGYTTPQYLNNVEASRFLTTLMLPQPHRAQIFFPGIHNAATLTEEQILQISDPSLALAMLARLPWQAPEFINNPWIFSLVFEKLLNPTDLPVAGQDEATRRQIVTTLTIVGSERPYRALRRGLLSANDVSDFNTEALTQLLTENGLLLLERGYFTTAQLKPIAGAIAALSSDLGLKALATNLITARTLLAGLGFRPSAPTASNGIVMPNPDKLKLGITNLQLLLTHQNGLALLRHHQFDLSELTKLSTLNLKSRLSDSRLVAIDENLLTPKQANAAHMQYILGMTTTGPNALQALREKLLTFKQAKEIYNKSKSSLSALMSDNGLNALRQKLITPEQALLFYSSGLIATNHDYLHFLFNAIGSEVLRRKYITPEQACLMPDLTTLLCPDYGRDENLLKAFELGLVTSTDFDYGSRYSFWRVNPPNYGWRSNHLPTMMKQLVDNHCKNQAYKQELQTPIADPKAKAAITIQQTWRKHHKEAITRRNGLFAQINKQLIAPTRLSQDAIMKLSNTKLLAGNYRFKEAEEQLAMILQPR